MLRGCVKLLVLALPGWRESQGVIIETAAAKALDIPVEVLTVGEAGLPCRPGAATDRSGLMIERNPMRRSATPC